MQQNKKHVTLSCINELKTMELQYIFDCLSIAVIALLGAMSPGPDFAIVTRFALSGSRQSAILAALGVALAILVHVTYCALGIATLLVESPLLFRAIQIAGSLYLGYLGIKLLLPSKEGQLNATLPHRQAFKEGFLCNLLNPKATLFIFGVFTQFATPHMPLYILFIYGLIISIVALGWFCTLSYLITHPLFKDHFAQWQSPIMKGMGLLLLIVAVSVLFQAC
jgi:threonine/homoserine/homoserine lactone efflux protein